MLWYVSQPTGVHWEENFFIGGSSYFLRVQEGGVQGKEENDFALQLVEIIYIPVILEHAFVLSPVIMLSKNLCNMRLMFL